MIIIFYNFWKVVNFPKVNKKSNCLGAPVFRQKIGIFVYVEAIFFEA